MSQNVKFIILVGIIAIGLGVLVAAQYQTYTLIKALPKATPVATALPIATPEPTVEPSATSAVKFKSVVPAPTATPKVEE